MARQELNLLDKIKRYYAFGYGEIKNLIITILILGFIVGFNDGTTQGTITYWLFNLVNSIIIVALAVIVHVSGHRISALFAHFRAEYRVWWYGLLVGLILSILSRGQLWFLLPGGYIVDMLERHRTGRFRYGINYWPLGLIGFMGAFFNIVLAFIFKLLMHIPFLESNPLIQKAMLVNVLIAIFSLLPLPGLSGANMLYASRLAYVSMYVWVILAGTLLSFFSLFATVVLSFIGAVIAFLIFYSVYEKASWGAGFEGP